jgi:putative transposase
VKFAFIDEKQVAFPVGAMCRALGVSSSGYYEWRKRLPGPRTKDDARLAVEITAAHKRSRGTYGSPRVHAELRARGTRVGKTRVERLMRENDLQARRKRRFVTRPRGAYRKGLRGQGGGGRRAALSIAGR